MSFNYYKSYFVYKNALYIFFKSGPQKCFENVHKFIFLAHRPMVKKSAQSGWRLGKLPYFDPFFKRTQEASTYLAVIFTVGLIILWTKYKILKKIMEQCWQPIFFTNK